MRMKVGLNEHRDILKSFTSLNILPRIFSLCVLSSLGRKLLAACFRLVRFNEDEVELEEFEGLPLREPSASCFFLVIYVLQILADG